MDRLLRVVVLDIRELPYIARVLPLRVSRQLADVRTLEVALGWILRRNPDWVKAPCVVVVLRPPVDGLVPPGQSPCGVKAVPEVLDDPVAELEPLVPEHGIEDGVERDYLSVVDVVSDLPADRPLRMENTDAFADYALLRLKVVVE